MCMYNTVLEKEDNEIIESNYWFTSVSKQTVCESE